MVPNKAVPAVRQERRKSLLTTVVWAAPRGYSMSRADSASVALEFEWLSTASLHSPARQKSGDPPTAEGLRSKGNLDWKGWFGLYLLKPAMLLSVWETSWEG